MDLAAERYYQAHFPHTEVLDLLARKWTGRCVLAHRELCIESVDDVFIRYQAATSAQELKRLFREKRVLKLHSGGVYEQAMAERKGAQTLMVPSGRELIFEIDANDYELAGVDATDIEACDAAWPLVAFGMVALQHILREHFGFEHLLLTYSGRRGAHLTVHDERACRLTNEERRAVLAFVQPPKAARPDDGTHAPYGNMMDAAFFGGMWQKIVLPFWGHCLKPRVAGGMGLLDSQGDRDDFVRAFSANATVQDQLHTVMQTCALGVDAFRAAQRWVDKSKYAEQPVPPAGGGAVVRVVPAGRRRERRPRPLSKHPFSVHPKTGRLCVPVPSDPSRFDPARDAPTVQGVVDGVAADAEALEAGLRVSATSSGGRRVSGRARLGPKMLTYEPPPVATWRALGRPTGRHHTFPMKTSGARRSCAQVPHGRRALPRRGSGSGSDAGRHDAAVRSRLFKRQTAFSERQHAPLTPRTTPSSIPRSCTRASALSPTAASSGPPSAWTSTAFARRCARCCR